LLLQAGADANRGNGKGSTPLYAAVCYGNTAVVELLLVAGAEVDTATGDGSTPLMMVAQEGHEAVVGVLLRAGALVDKTKERVNTEPLTPES